MSIPTDAERPARRIIVEAIPVCTTIIAARALGIENELPLRILVCNTAAAWFVRKQSAQLRQFIGPPILAQEMEILCRHCLHKHLAHSLWALFVERGAHNITWIIGLNEFHNTAACPTIFIIHLVPFSRRNTGLVKQLTASLAFLSPARFYELRINRAKHIREAIVGKPNVIIVVYEIWFIRGLRTTQGRWPTVEMFRTE